MPKKHTKICSKKRDLLQTATKKNFPPNFSVDEGKFERQKCVTCTFVGVSVDDGKKDRITKHQEHHKAVQPSTFLGVPQRVVQSLNFIVNGVSKIY